MSKAFISVMAFADWLEHENEDLFSKMILPEGIDREILIDNIKLKSAELEVLYANPYFMQDAIGIWSKKYFRTFEKWYEALSLEYNVLDNYDRFEEWTDTGSASASSNDHTGTTIEDKKSAFDSNTYENNALSNNASDSNSSSSSNNSAIHTGRIRGNIGITSSMELIQKQLDLVKNFNLYEQITDLFLQEFCLLVY